MQTEPRQWQLRGHEPGGNVMGHSLGSPAGGSDGPAAAAISPVLSLFPPGRNSNNNASPSLLAPPPGRINSPAPEFRQHAASFSHGLSHHHQQLLQQQQHQLLQQQQQLQQQQLLQQQEQHQLFLQQQQQQHQSGRCHSFDHDDPPLPLHLTHNLTSQQHAPHGSGNGAFDHSHHHAQLQQHLQPRGASAHQLSYINTGSNDFNDFGSGGGGSGFGGGVSGGGGDEARLTAMSAGGRPPPPAFARDARRQLQRLQAEYKIDERYDQQYHRMVPPTATVGSPSWPQLPTDFASGGGSSALGAGCSWHADSLSGLTRRVSDSHAERQLALQLQQQQQRYGSGGGALHMPAPNLTRAPQHQTDGDAFTRQLLQQAPGGPGSLGPTQQQQWQQPLGWRQTEDIDSWSLDRFSSGGGDNLSDVGGHQGAADNFSLPQAAARRQLQMSGGQDVDGQVEHHRRQLLLMQEQQQQQLQVEEAFRLYQQQQQQQLPRLGQQQQQQLYMNLSDPGSSVPNGASIHPASRHSSPEAAPHLHPGGLAVGMPLADVPARLLQQQQQQRQQQQQQQDQQQQRGLEALIRQQQRQQQQQLDILEQLQQQRQEPNKPCVRAHAPADVSHAQSAVPTAAASAADRSAMKRAGSLSESLAPGDKAQLSHRDMEKQRRDRINTLIDELADIVPPSSVMNDGNGDSRQRSKHSVLADTLSLVNHILKVLPELAEPTDMPPSDLQLLEHSPVEGAARDAQLLLEDTVAELLRQEDAMDDVNMAPHAVNGGRGAGVGGGGSLDVHDATCVQVRCSDGQLPGILNALRTLPCEFMTDSD